MLEFDTVTTAFGTMAPEASITVPLIAPCPASDWANMGEGTRNSAPKNRRSPVFNRDIGVFLLSWKFFQSPEPVPCATPEFNATLHALDL